MDISALITPPAATAPATGNALASSPAVPFAQQLQQVQRPTPATPTTDEPIAPALPIGLEAVLGIAPEQWTQALATDSDPTREQTPADTLAQLLAQVGVITPVPVQQPSASMGTALTAEAPVPANGVTPMQLATDSTEQNPLLAALSHVEQGRDELTDTLPVMPARPPAANRSNALEPQTNLHSAAALNDDVVSALPNAGTVLNAEAATQTARATLANDDAAPAPARHEAVSVAPNITTGTNNSLNSANPAAPNVTATLSAPLATAQWQRGLEQHVLSLHQRGSQHMELRLHPEELGPLAISLKLGDNGAQAQFMSAHPQVRAAVEQALPQLRDALAEQGIVLSDASVGEHTQQAPQDQQAQGDRPQFAGNVNNGEKTNDSPELPAARAVRLDGRVDLYA